MSDISFLGDGAIALISDTYGNFVALWRLFQRRDSQGI
jgi:hypothetical protein